MSEPKTKENDASVTEFIDSLEDPHKRQDGHALLDMYKRVTGEEPRMWGDAIVGFSKYRIKAERGKQESEWPLAGFSPRKQTLTLYLMPEFDTPYADLLAKLGKHTTSKTCLYIKRLADVDLVVLEETLTRDFKEAKQKLT